MPTKGKRDGPCRVLQACGIATFLASKADIRLRGSAPPALTLAMVA
jgi:hypothetical protein